MNGLKIGDKVKVIGGYRNHDFKSGEVLTIVDNVNNSYFFGKNKSGLRQLMAYSEVKKVDE